MAKRSRFRKHLGTRRKQILNSLMFLASHENKSPPDHIFGVEDTSVNYSFVYLL